MTELTKPNNRSDVYLLEDRSQQVSTAKSQFAEEYDADYSDLHGKIIDRSSGRGRSYPAFCVVVEVDE